MLILQKEDLHFIIIKTLITRMDLVKELSFSPKSSIYGTGEVYTIAAQLFFFGGGKGAISVIAGQSII